MVIPRIASAFTASLLLFSAISVSAQSLDECATYIESFKTAPGPLETRSTPADVAKACFNVFPADAAFKAQHVRELKPIIETYPFADMYLAPPGPPRTFGAPGIDVLKELDRLAADPTLTTQYAFFSQIHLLATSLHDAHFSYIPFCMGTSTFRQPFYLGAVYPTADGEPVIKVVDTAPASWVWDAALGTSDLSTFLNHTVRTIDGLPAAAYIQQTADRLTGYARSPASRFNHALTRKVYVDGEFINEPGFISQTDFLPSDTQARTYVLSPPPLPDGTQPADITLTVPWAAFANGIQSIFTLTNQEYYDIFCLDFRVPRQLSRRDVSPLIPEPKPRRGFVPRATTPADALEDIHAVPTISDGVVAAALARRALPRRRQEELVPVVSSASTAFYVLDDGITGVWVFPTVSPFEKYPKWLGAITGGLRAFEKSGVKRLIVDVSSNGGGDFCAATALAEYLLQNTAMIEDQLRLTPAVRSLLKLGFYNKLTNTTGDILTSAYLQDRGNGPQLLSGRFKVCQSVGRTPADFIRTFNLPELERGWAPEDVSVVSDGGCGSSCGCWLRSLRDAHPGLKAYTYGGRTTTPYTPTSFEGGLVAGFEGLAKYTPAIASLSPEERAALPVNLTSPNFGGLPVTQGYSPLGRDGLTFPAEWVPQPADEHLVIRDPADKKGLWEAVAGRMRVPGEPVPRTRVVPLSTTTVSASTVSVSASTSATASVSLPSTSAAVGTTTAAVSFVSSSTTTTTTATTSSSSTFTSSTTATSSTNTAPEATPEADSYGIDPAHHAGWHVGASHNAHNAQNAKPNAVSNAVPNVPAGAGGAYAAALSKAMTTPTTTPVVSAKKAGNVYVSGATGRRGVALGVVVMGVVAGVLIL
ncbi:hypothetical protein HDU96_011082 [Phlyctochytrium bullatum]|nr:hypothetical protein HDU96_011082 [Phlyctochytrium bullatum]